MENKIELWQMYCAIKKVIAKKFRTNNIEGEITEELMAKFYGGELAKASCKGYDFTVDSKKIPSESKNG